jgi:class 3 adenylate cyclase/pimeloyl-ACP methyl ester carboxylesterase
MSDPLTSGGAPPLEQQVSDVLAVMDSVGSRRAALYASSQAGPVALLFAAMHPDRVGSLVLHNSWARWYAAPDYPMGPPMPPESDLKIDGLLNAKHWGDLENPITGEWIALSRVDDPSFRRVLARVQQISASRAAAAVAPLVDMQADVRAILELVRAPALVLCGADFERLYGPASVHLSQYLVEHLPDARLALFPGADIYFGVHTPALGAIIEEFLTGTRPVAASDRILATVLFTDVAASTALVAEIGDRQWRSYLDQHDAMVRTQLDRFRGREINTTGDGFFATFDGPARAVRCAQAILDSARSLGIEVRAGVHVGECEVRGNDLAGIAVHIGARVCALAQPGEVYATSTVRDLVAGSGIEFAERGRHALRGVPGEWTILAAED